MRRQPGRFLAPVLLCSGGLLLLAVAPVRAQAPAASGRLTPDEYLDWEDVNPPLLTGGLGPQVSPDGQRIVYTRRHVDRMHDRWVPELWIVNADGSRNRFLAAGANAVWSPDGTRILYSRDGQLFVRWMDAEGATTQVTRVEHGAGAPAWSPDGRWIAFSMMVPSKPGLTIQLPPRPPGAEWTPDAKVITREHYRQDQVGYVDQGWRHIFVIPATGGTPRQVTDGAWNDGAPTWSEDGREILFSGLRRADAERQWRESEIYAVSVADGTVRQLTHRKGPDTDPVVSPDGKWIAYTGFDYTDDSYITNKLYLMAMDGSGAREIDGGLDRSPMDLLWSPDGSGVYFSAEDSGTVNLFFASVRGGPARRVTDVKGIQTVYSMSRTGLAVGTRSTPAEPGDVVAFDVHRPADAHQLTHVNDDVLAGKKLGAVEEIPVRSADGLWVQAWVVKPPDFDPHHKYPLMLSIHGGPHMMFGYGTPYMWFEWQTEAAADYVVLYVNPRGSSSYGSAFGNAINHAYPGKDYDDLMAAVDTVLGRGYVDADNMFVYGCSGGGVLTSWIVGHTDRFAAASVECPVIDWLSFVGTTDGAGWYRNFRKLPWDDPSEYLARSPLMYVGHVHTPTMLTVGERDLRTPRGQTEEYYQALQLLGVPTAMVRLQDEFHAYFRRPTNMIRMLEYRRAWFERYRKHPRAAGR